MNTRIIPFLLISCLVFFAFITGALGQDDPETEDVSLDLLRAPLSPAANLLGISSSQIEKPSDPAAFMASIQTASGNFTAIPTSYAVDLAPAWLIAGSKITLEDYLSPKAGKSMSQSFVLSVATNTIEADADTLPDVTRLSAGIKFSVLRGQVSNESKKQLEELGIILGLLTVHFGDALDSMKKQDDRYQSLDSVYKSILNNPSIPASEKPALTKPFRDKLVAREDTLSQLLRNDLNHEFERAREASEALRITRYGFKLDIAAGIIWDFPGMNFDQGETSTLAAWATGGYECPCGFSLLAIARYLNFTGVPIPGDQQLILYRDYSSMDGGLRLIWANPSSRFSTSIEGLYRMALNNADIDPAWRFALNAEYEVGRNKKLSLILGRDFDGTLTGDGDLIVALNFLLGFGTDKKL